MLNLIDNKTNLMNKAFTIIWISLISVLNANPVDTNTAMTVARRFLQSQTDMQLQKSNPTLQLVYQAVSHRKNADPLTYFYVYNIEPKGYIIVSGNDNVIPVLGYSDESTFNPEQIPANMSSFLSECKREIACIVDNNIEASEETQMKWNDLLYGNLPVQKDVKSGVSPLIKTKWSQSPYYNNLCPLDSDSHMRAVTGCVATAMAQVINYWKYPQTGFSSHSYVHDQFGELNASFENTVYSYDIMPVQLTSTTASDSLKAVATLMYHCGVAVEMDYGVFESGAYLDELTVGKQSAEYALRTYFGYSSVKSDHRYILGDIAWIAMLKSQLNARKPVLYRGQGDGGGHAFVCDGYDANNFFHFNWGWGGSSDGYFAVTSLNPGAYYDFTSYQGAVYDIIAPNQSGDFHLILYDRLNLSASSVVCESPFSITTKVMNNGSLPFKGVIRAVVLNGAGGEVCDVSRVLIDNQNTLNPDNDTNLVFSIDGISGIMAGAYKLKLFYCKENDTLWLPVISVGDYENEKVITFTGDVSVETDSVNQIGAQSAMLYGTLTEGCAQIVAKGFKWKKSSESNFNTIFADDSSYVLRLDNLIPNTSYICKAFLTTYASTIYGTVYGDEIAFTTAPLSIDEALLSNKINIYPNPAKDFIYIENNSEDKILDIQLLSVSGQMVYNCKSVTSSLCVINIDAFAKGIYSLRLITPTGILNKKVIIE